MNTYVNRFSFSTNNYKDEIAISFAQELPRFADDGSIEEVNYEPVANLILNKRVAVELAQKLIDMLNAENTDSTVEPVE